MSAKKILEHGFHKINLIRIYCSTSSKNKAMINLALKLGFKKEGIRRNHLYLNNDFDDMIEFGLLKSEYNLS